MKNKIIVLFLILAVTVGMSINVLALENDTTQDIEQSESIEGESENEEVVEDFENEEDIEETVSEQELITDPSGDDIEEPVVEYALKFIKLATISSTQKYAKVIIKCTGYNNLTLNGGTPVEITPENSQYEFKVLWGTTCKFVADKGLETEKSLTVAVPSNKKIAIKALHDYNSVTLRWTKTKGAYGYYIYRGGKKIKYLYGKNITYKKINGVTKVVWRNTGLKKNINYSYNVRAVYRNPDGNKIVIPGTKSVTVKSSRLRNITFKITIKYGWDTTLYCHCCSKKQHKLRVHGGDTFTATSFSSGRYYFEGPDGHKYAAIRLRCTKQKAIIDTDKNYTAEEALNYVNHRKVKSETSKLILASYYTQHFYVFKGNGKTGKWSKVLKQGEISSGMSWKPSPTGSKRIHNKVSYRHDLPWWSCFSSWNSFHGKCGQWKLGVPMSSGCVRLTNTNAKWFYYNVPIGSKALMY